MKTVLTALILLAVAVTFTVLSVTAQREGFNPIGHVAGKLWHLFLFLVFWFAVYGCGRGAERLLTGRTSWPPELALGLGVVASVLLAFVLCAAHAAYGVVAKVIVIFGAAATAALTWRRLAEVPARLKRALEELELGSAALLAGTALLAASIALSAAEPPYFWDALTYHLAVPQAYAEAHRFVYLADNVYSSMPFGASLFYLWPYLWDGAITANASHLVVTLLALGLTYRLARAWVSQYYAVLAAAFVFLTPTVLTAAGGAQVDHFSMLFIIAALFLYLNPGVGEGSSPRRRAVAVGLFLGAALAVKYSSFPVLIAFIPIWAYDVARKRTRPAEVAIIIGTAVLLVVPWLIKAYVERGNPVFPALYGTFGGRDFSAEQARRLFEWQASMGRGRGIADWLLLPYRVSFEAGYPYEDFCGLLLPFVLPLAAVAVPAFRRAGRVVAFAWVYFFAWALGPQQLRFLAGALPAFGIAAAGVLAAAEPGGRLRLGRWWRAIIAVAFLAVAFSYNAMGIFDTLPGHSYFFWMDEEEFLSRRCPFYNGYDYMNRELPPGARVLLVFANQTLYLERDATYDSFLEASAPLILAEESADGEALYRYARERGITHVYVYKFFEERFWPYYTPRARHVFYDFVRRYGYTVYEDKFGDVYELLPATGGD
ncbi:MAG: hypothetical protein PVH29_06400 [Candidatus Zixiibacteriota bacterium]